MSTPASPTPPAQAMTAHDFAELCVDNGEGGAQIEVHDKDLRRSLILNIEKQCERRDAAARQSWEAEREALMEEITLYKQARIEQYSARAIAESERALLEAEVEGLRGARQRADALHDECAALLRRIEEDGEMFDYILGQVDGRKHGPPNLDWIRKRQQAVKEGRYNEV